MKDNETQTDVIAERDREAVRLLHRLRDLCDENSQMGEQINEWLEERPHLPARMGVVRSQDDVPALRDAGSNDGGQLMSQSGDWTQAKQGAALEALRSAWARNPQLRLCQLIVNATERNDPFYVEDAALVAALMKYPSGGQS